MAEKNDVALALLRRELPVPGSDLGPLYEPNVGDHLRDIDYLLGKRVEEYGEAIARALMAPGNALRGEYDEVAVMPDGSLSMSDPRMISDAAELAGLVSLGAAPMPRPAGSLGMGASVHSNIDLLAQELRARGIGTGTPQKSINRHGEYSAYMDTPLGEVRLSDHSNNPNFNTSAANLYDFGDGTFNPAAEADRIAAAIEQSRVQQAAAKAAREAFIAPYAQRYKAATTNSERDAVLREYIENRTDGPRRWDEMSRNDRNSLRRLLMGGS